MARSLDLRKTKRYKLKAPVKFSWQRSDGEVFQGTGLTRDISPRGVFVVCTDTPPSGTMIKVQVTLPSLGIQRRTGPCLRTLGHVVRAETHGFAVSGDLGFRVQFSNEESLTRHFGNEGGKHEAKQSLVPVTRFSM